MVMLLSSSTVVAQKVPLTYTTRLISVPCLGDKLEIEGTLSNISDKDVWIERTQMWRYSIEKALDQFGSSNIPILRMPLMRSSKGDSFYIDGSEDENLMRLKPGESFTDLIEIDPEADDFFRLPGRFSITYGYGQFIKRSTEGIKPWVGSINADELNFTIKSCAEGRPAPSNYDDVEKAVFLYNEFARIGKFEELKTITHVIKSLSNDSIESLRGSLLKLNEEELIQEKLEIERPTLIFLSKLKTFEIRTLESSEEKAKVLVTYLSDLPDQETTPQIFSLIKIDGAWKTCNIEAFSEASIKATKRNAEKQAMGDEINIKIGQFLTKEGKLPNSLSDIGSEDKLEGPIYYKKIDDNRY